VAQDVVIRAALESDLAAANDICNHYVRTSHVTFDLEPTSLEARHRWFDDRRQGRHRVFVAEMGGRVAGFASSGPHNARGGYETTVDTNVYVAPDSVGSGIGRRLYAALFDALRDQDLHRALAGIAQPNAASVALHLRFGFRRVAHFSEQGRKFGRFWDVDWYERALGGSSP
jgi:phosphinothricin acetyltransferase